MIDFHRICCNGLQEPLCIDKTPVFSWNYTGGCDRNVVQKAYRIEVLDENGAVLFSQKKKGAAMRFTYSGRLQPLTDYAFRITAWLSNGQVLQSRAQHFASGLMGKKWESFGANWIAGTKKYEHCGLSFRRSFSVAKAVRSAKAYLLATAWQRVSVNGAELKADHYMLPCNSPYLQKCVYEAYELPLQQGENRLEVLTGGGYNSGYSQWGWRVFCGKTLVGFVEICYADGTKERIVTDENWELYSTQMTYCDIYHGQHTNANLLPEKLENARVIPSPLKKAVFVANEMPPVKVIRQISPLSYRTERNSRLYDMGENFCGVAKISLRAPKGTKITLQFSELVYSNGEQRTTSNYKAKAQDQYICSGEGLETFLPQFTYHGYRYVKVSGLSAKVQDFTVTGMALSADVGWASSFRCSDGVVNAVHENAVRSLQSNLVTIPTDCPSRGERTPCAMDSQCVEFSNLYNFDMHSYYRKWIEDLVLYIDTISDHPNPDWDGDRFLLAHRLLTHCNDSELVRRYYTHLKNYLNRTFIMKSPDNLWHDGFGDWCHPNENTWETFHSSVEIVNTCLFYSICRAMADMAAELGKTADAEEFTQYAQKIRQAFVQAYLKPDGTVNDGIHTEQVMALDSGILPEQWVQPVLETLCRKLETEPMDLGIFGTSALARVLPQYGKNDLLLKLLHNPQYPGFLYCIANGATSLWEVWNFDGRMASHNHAMFGGIDEAFYAGFAGIRPLEKGFARFCVKPALPEGMSFADCTVETVSGVIQTEFRRHGAGVELKLTVPANTQAEVYLPEIIGGVLYDGEVILPDSICTKQDGCLHLTLGSGSYHLRLIDSKLLFENTYENRYIVTD